MSHKEASLIKIHNSNNRQKRFDAIALVHVIDHQRIKSQAHIYVTQR